MSLVKRKGKEMTLAVGDGKQTILLQLCMLEIVEKVKP